MSIDREIGQILNGYQPAFVLMTANKVKLFDAVAELPVTAEDAASACGLSTRGTVRLLNALAGMEIVLRENDRYQLNPSWAPYLTAGGEHGMQQWIRLIFDLAPVWLELPRFVETGAPVKSIMEVLGNDPEETRAFIDAMHNKALKATWEIARMIPLGDYRKMLDLGGGPGTYALEWAKLHQHLRARVFDLPNVLTVTEDYIRTYGLEDRVTTLEGDFTRDDLGSGYDLILAANVLHMYDEESAAELVSRAARALRPGGRLIVHGFCTDEGDTGPINDILFSLNIGLLTEGGSAHPVPEMITWLEEAGIEEVHHFRIDAIPTGVLTGIRSAAG